MPFGTVAVYLKRILGGVRIEKNGFLWYHNKRIAAAARVYARSAGGTKEEINIIWL